jgi:Major Facilitator Superfamily
MRRRWPAAPYAGAPSAGRPARRPVTLLALCVAAFIISLDVTIVNVALPALVRQAGATTTDLQWVVDAYNLVFAALVLVAGSLSDRLGRKGMLLAGLGVFGAASWPTGRRGHPGLPAQLCRRLPRRRRSCRGGRDRGRVPASRPARPARGGAPGGSRFTRRLAPFQRP